MIGFASSSRFVEHDPSPTHPERPDRIRAIYGALHQAGLLTSPNPFDDFKMNFGLKPLAIPKLLELDFKPADLKWIYTVHPEAYVRHVEHISQHGGVLDQGDTPVEPRSFETAVLAVGAVLRCCDAVMTGEVNRAFAAVRPPGHHAEPHSGMGFCLFNNIAIAARYLERTYALRRIAIIDFDVHHGNGTQAAFEDDPAVLFVSLHQDPRTLYPGSGHAWEVGIDAGRGYTINLPLQPGSDDEDYLRAIDTRVIPKLDDFQPEILLISAGFDAHRDDPLAEMGLTDDGFEAITRRLVTVAEKHCKSRVVSVLEGGYNLLTLGRSVVRHLIGLSTEAQRHEGTK